VTPRGRLVGRFAAALVLLTFAAGPVAAADPGVTWTGQVPVGPIQQVACNEALARTTTPGGRVVLHVASLRGGGYPNAAQPAVLYQRSLDGGSTWAAPVRLRISPSEPSSCPAVAASGPVVVIAWQETSSRVGVLRLRVSMNHGKTWEPTRVVPAPVSAGAPSVAVAGTTIHVAWTDAVAGQTWSRAARSTDHGRTWVSRRLDAYRAAGGTRIAAAGSLVIAAWVRSPGGAVIARISTDGGRTWRYPDVLGSTFAAGSLVDVGIAARPDRLAVAWPGRSHPEVDNPEVRLRVHAGGAWQPTVIVPATPPVGRTYSHNHEIAVTLLAGSRIGLAWAAAKWFDEYVPWTYDDVLWSESSDNGASWTPVTSVSPLDTEYLGHLWSTAVGVSATWASGDLRGVLVDRRDAEESNFRLFFNRGSAMP
jgi:hypothetical protein